MMQLLKLPVKRRWVFVTDLMRYSVYGKIRIAQKGCRIVEPVVLYDFLIRRSGGASDQSGEIIRIHVKGFCHRGKRTGQKILLDKPQDRDHLTGVL